MIWNYIALSISAFLLGLSIGALITLYKLYVNTRSALVKIFNSFIDKIHGVDIDFNDLWDKIRKAVDLWFGMRR